jgi:hypothetical protein
MTALVAETRAISKALPRARRVRGLTAGLHQGTGSRRRACCGSSRRGGARAAGSEATAYRWRAGPTAGHPGRRRVKRRPVLPPVTEGGPQPVSGHLVYLTATPECGSVAHNTTRTTLSPPGLNRHAAGIFHRKFTGFSTADSRKDFSVI